MAALLVLGVCGFASVAAACSAVSPEVPAGEPTPALVLSVDQVEPLAGEVTLTATPVNFDPDVVTFRRHGDPTPLATVTSAPFEVVVDTATIADGASVFKATGTDGTYSVVRADVFRTRNDPNVAVVYVDDLDDTATSYWDALPQTQALLADRGVTFTNSFVTDSHCCPARATTLTGRYPHNTGVFDGTAPDGGFSVFRDNGSEADTVATRLHDEGYTTGFVGKYLNGYESDPTYVAPGWDDWFALAGGFYDGYGYDVNDNGTIVGYGSEPADYQTDVLAEQSVEFLEGTEADDDRPFFLFVAPTAPHSPIQPAPRHQPNPFGADPLPTRPNFDEVDVSDKPTWLRDGSPPLNATRLSFMLGDHRKRMGSLLAVDDMVASLVATLEANGELDDTVIVFTSDNGYNLGAHRRPGKRLPYEESIRVPLVVAGPGVPVGTDDRLVTNLDLAPTLLDVAGVDASDLDGRSWEPLFEGENPTWRRDFLVEYNGTYSSSSTWHTFEDVQNQLGLGNPGNPATHRALRSEQWLYVQWYAGAVHEYELYDMTADPYQLDNLVATPGGAEQYAGTTALLQARLDALAVCSSAACRT